MQKEFNYNEIQTLVNALNEEEFLLLKEAVNERNIEEYGLRIGEIDPDSRVVDQDEIIIAGHTFLYGEKQIDYIRKNLDKELEEGTTDTQTYRPIIKYKEETPEVKISEKSREICADIVCGLDHKQKVK